MLVCNLAIGYAQFLVIGLHLYGI
ncbi:hypothetical protein CHELA20_50583 [Hyphomicrobiales bacterium]|nr:hypothetical protein CHELA20_50583 [Hyphomicrobiales bacterium]CAH1678491.1 hypothetical protein CHELA41_24544 [Hyphomicrobiales bacterium]